MKIVIRILEDEGLTVRTCNVGKQKDGWTCGYHMLEWTRQIMDKGKAHWKKEGPALQYETAAVVRTVWANLKEIEKEGEQAQELPKQEAETQEEEKQQVETEEATRPQQKGTTQQGTGTTSWDPSVSATTILMQIQEGSRQEHRHQPQTKETKRANRGKGTKQSKVPLKSSADSPTTQQGTKTFTWDPKVSAMSILEQLQANSRQQHRHQPQVKETKRTNKQKGTKGGKLNKGKPMDLEGRDQIHIVSNNMEGGLQPRAKGSKAAKVWDTIREQHIDVLMLQDTRISTEEIESERWRHTQSRQAAGSKVFTSENVEKPTKQESHPS